MENIKNSIIERFLAAVVLVGGAIAAFFVAYFNPVTAGFFPVCPLYAMTGLLCPGCGLTRGFHALFHGDILGALQFNAFVPFFFLLFAYLAVLMLSVLTRGRGLSFNIFRPRLVYPFLAILLIYAVVRNLPFFPFTVLAPQ